MTNTVHLATLEKSRAKEVADIISENCDVTPNSDGQRIVNVTGVGTLKAWTFLEEKLKAK